MDQESFDTLTRTLAAGMSRRGVLHTLSALGAGGVAAVVGGGNVAAGKCRRRNRCGKGKHRTCCKNGKICIQGECVTTCEPDCTNKCGGGQRRLHRHLRQRLCLRARLRQQVRWRQRRLRRHL